jgi:type IV secretory pathway VirD2 relaxase
VSTDKSPQETEQVLLERERKMLKERLDFIQNKLEKV